MTHHPPFLACGSVSVSGTRGQPRAGGITLGLQTSRADPFISRHPDPLSKVTGAGGEDVMNVGRRMRGLVVEEVS